MTDFLTIASPLPVLARERPAAPALLSPTGTLTYAELEELSSSCARGLYLQGLREGSRVVLLVRPSPEFLILTFGLIKLGAVPVLVDPGMGWKNLGQCLKEASPQAFVGIPPAHWARRVLGWGKDSLNLLLCVGSTVFTGASSYNRLMREGAQAPPLPGREISLEAPAAIAFTSGSTGVPKGVVYTHSMFSAQVRLLREQYSIEPGEVDLATFPLFALFDPALGVTTVFPRMDFTRPARVDPESIIDPIVRNRVTHLFGSPALLNRVGRYAQQQGLQLHGLKRVLSAGAPVPERVLRLWRSILSPAAEIHTPYGATEALPVCSIGSGELLSESPQARGVCVGRPLSGVDVAVIRIDDNPIGRWEETLVAAPGEVGELVVRGDNVSREYFARPRANASAKIPDEQGQIRHRMGDLGYFDDQGRIWFCGRKAHRVITAEGTLFTVPCEKIFNQHPAFFSSALVGVGSVPGQKPVLCVELEKQAKGSRGRIRREILEIGAGHPETRAIRTVLFHPSFPVDVRHNAKIFREKLAVWAGRKLRKG